ncbi:ATP synthase F1 subunit delta [Polyangium jinanense]|uniref:ATP synthase subunit delta n=1 Tax=Polyangium jinanense TaxID=2829994 RepID=A0A9X3WYW2_9BACT|nr:ATP synthase F1 subunit delta [Polyangium jinanense]MDC3953591.1 ATP synthase F1 subunit delta [Polyangium jinanense]MDC3979288.1 ATP synthase F1 subunit delta [Polyangium jinanense]
MSSETIARRYARAVFELGKELKNLPVIARDLADFSASFEKSDELRMVLSSPLIAEEQREALLKEVGQRMSLSETALSTLRLLAKRRRLSALPDMVRQLEKLVDEDAGTLRATVTSAGPLSESYLAKLRAELEKSTGRKVVITNVQDPSLIAGIVTRIGDRVIDGSVKARLESFRESLLRT